MKIIIAGSRNHKILSEWITRYMEIFKLAPTEIVSGGAPGIDACGEAWAIENNYPLKIFRADWDKYGRGAGPRRNSEMAEYADLLLAFWDGESPGTKNMVQHMQKRGKPYHLLLVPL